MEKPEKGSTQLAAGKLLVSILYNSKTVSSTMKGKYRFPSLEAMAHRSEAILQRVVSASVTVDKTLVSSIGQGVLVFAAIGPDDTKKDAESMASKILKMRMWPDESGSGVS